MSVRVDLLPQETTRRQAAARQRTVIAGGLLTLVLLLAAVSLWQSSRIGGAEDRLAEEEAVLASLQQEQTELEDFAELERRIDRSQELIVQALGDEVSLAGILQDVAAVMPADAELENLSVTLSQEAATDPEADVDPDAETPPRGTLVAVGRSLNDHAPGLERLLLEFDKVASFHDLFFTSSVLSDPEVPYPTFTVEAQLGSEVLTQRYTDGVPEELR